MNIFCCCIYLFIVGYYSFKNKKLYINQDAVNYLNFANFGNFANYINYGTTSKEEYSSYYIKQSYTNIYNIKFIKNYKMKREIKYPIFLECSAFCGKEVFWKFVFEDMAYAKFPPSVYIQKDYLCCSSKGKEFVYKLMENGQIFKSNEMVYEEVRKLLQTRACLLSDKEALFQRKSVLHSRQLQFEKERYNEESWNVIRKKIIKESLMEQYVLESKNKYSLHPLQVKRLFSLIIIGFLFKTIHSKDVLYGDGYIQAIDGFELDHELVTCHKNIYMTDSTSLLYTLDMLNMLNTMNNINHTNNNKMMGVLKEGDESTIDATNSLVPPPVVTAVPSTLSSHWTKYLASLPSVKHHSNSQY
jgi:hypothetical protein